MPPLDKDCCQLAQLPLYYHRKEAPKALPSRFAQAGETHRGQRGGESSGRELRCDGKVQGKEEEVDLNLTVGLDHTCLLLPSLHPTVCTKLSFLMSASSSIRQSELFAAYFRRAS